MFSRGFTQTPYVTTPTPARYPDSYTPPHSVKVFNRTRYRYQDNDDAGLMFFDKDFSEPHSSQQCDSSRPTPDHPLYHDTPRTGYQPKDIAHMSYLDTKTYNKVPQTGYHSEQTSSQEKRVAQLPQHLEGTMSLKSISLAGITKQQEECTASMRYRLSPVTHSVTVTQTTPLFYRSQMNEGLSAVPPHSLFSRDHLTTTPTKFNLGHLKYTINN